MKKIIFLLAIAVACVSQTAFADSALVRLKSGTEVKGTIISFNPVSEIVLDVAGFETRINMADVESVEKIVDATPATTSAPAPQVKVNPGAHPAVTHRGTIKTDKKGKQYIEVMGDDGQELTMVFYSDSSLEVTKARKDLSYKKRADYVIPDFVDIDGKIYSVESIGEEAFNASIVSNKITNVVFPSTLKVIKDRAFFGSAKMQRIILPDSLEEIGAGAFYLSGRYNDAFEELYIPETVKRIGSNAFICVGTNTSFNGYFQGRLTCIPDFVTVGNCTTVGIDEEAVEDYYRRNPK